MTLRIAHLSDIHFGDEDQGAVEAAIGAVSAFAPTLTVVTGDLTANGRVREFRAGGAWLARLPGPTLVTPGNHDTPYWNPILRLISPFARYRRYIGRSQTSALDLPGLSVRSLNSARGIQPRLNWSKGALSLHALRSLEWPAEPDVLRLFACHHPLVDPSAAPVSGGVHAGKAALAALAQQGVELILSGHLHNPFAGCVDGPGTASYTLGAGTLSRRTRGAAASFSTILAGDDAFEVVIQAWTGERFEVGPMRRLQRRPA
jgi:3',5'-cyclic AMP phosphodiesterase CpdA